MPLLFRGKNEQFYAFPPFALILQTLRKVINDDASRIVFVPFWPAQPWYLLFTSLLCQPPLVLEPKIELLQSPSTSSQTFSCSREIIREAYIKKEISSAAAEIMLDSITVDCESVWGLPKKMAQFCRTWKYRRFNQNTYVINFLQIDL